MSAEMGILILFGCVLCALIAGHLIMEFIGKVCFGRKETDIDLIINFFRHIIHKPTERGQNES